MEKKQIQIRRKISNEYKEKLLDQQNEIRKKYGLRPLKRIDTETFLKPDRNTSFAPKQKYIPDNGGMYQ